ERHTRVREGVSRRLPAAADVEVAKNHAARRRHRLFGALFFADAFPFAAALAGLRAVAAALGALRAVADAFVVLRAIEDWVGLRAGGALVFARPAFTFAGNAAAPSNARAIQRRSSSRSAIILSGSMILSLRARPSPIGSKGAAPSRESAAAR